MSSLLWLTINGPWNRKIGQSPLFTPAKSPTTTIGSPEANPTEKEPSFITAINTLKNEGCHVTQYDKYIDITGIPRLNFPEFKEKALKNGIVLIVPNDMGESILLIIEKKSDYIWQP